MIATIALVLIALVLLLGVWPALAALSSFVERMAAAQEAQLRVYASWCERQELSDLTIEPSEVDVYWPTGDTAAGTPGDRP